MIKKYARKGINGNTAQIILNIFLWLTVFWCLVPLIITILSSLKNNYELQQNIWLLPSDPLWSNWGVGFTGLLPNMLNSLAICAISTVIIVFVSAWVSYIFCRHNFAGKDVIFSLIIALLIVPSSLTLTPNFILMQKFHINETWFALILPYIAGGQVGTIFLFRTFMGQQPKELYEAAKVDGANDFVMYFFIAMPLAIPIIAIQTISLFSSYYNDFLWPMMVINNESISPLMPVLKPLASRLATETGQQGVVSVAFLVSGIPLLIITMLGLKCFINGDFSSGLKL